jgi:hypothetical protein
MSYITLLTRVSEHLIALHHRVINCDHINIILFSIFKLLIFHAESEHIFTFSVN